MEEKMIPDYDRAEKIINDLSVPSGDPIDALERIRDYAWLIMNGLDPTQKELDAGWIYSIAHQAIRKAKGE
jgi:hypothetical protein